MDKLFSYGTLQMESVQLDSFGRQLKGTKDFLVGYELSEIEIADKAVIESSGTNLHPILKYTGNLSDLVSGVVFEVSSEELAKADDYEVAEYTRVAAEFKSGNTAWIYVCAESTRIKQS